MYREQLKKLNALIALSRKLQKQFPTDSMLVLMEKQFIEERKLHQMKKYLHDAYDFNFLLAGRKIITGKKLSRPDSVRTTKALQAIPKLTFATPFDYKFYDGTKEDCAGSFAENTTARIFELSFATHTGEEKWNLRFVFSRTLLLTPVHRVEIDYSFEGNTLGQLRANVRGFTKIPRTKTYQVLGMPNEISKETFLQMLECAVVSKITLSDFP